MEFVEVRGKSVEVAVSAALAELGIASSDDAEVEVIDPGKKGFLGVGGTDAVVRVRPKRPEGGKRRRRRRGGKGDGERQGGKGDGQRQGAKPGGGQGAGARATAGAGQPRPERAPRQAPSRPTPAADAEPVDAQAASIEAFLTGLVGAFGLEAEVRVDASPDGVAAAIVGDQAETLVGEKGAVMQAVQEITRTVVQRRFHHPTRVRVDVAGYAERRRQALAIYAERLAAQVIEEGGEIMLEPMSAADRKVVHDTVAGIDGVRSYSEGEEPRRCVVIGKE